MKKLSTLFLLLFIACTANGQVKIQRAPDLSLQNPIPEPEINRIINALNLRLEEYGKAATLFNKNTRSINDESVAEFKNLFTPDAKICNDLYEYEEQLPGIDAYISLAMKYYDREGIRFTLTDPVLISISELDQKYACKVSLTKQTEKYYKGNGAVVSEIKIHELEFEFSLRKGDWNSTLINAIRGKKVNSTIAPYITYRGVDINFEQLHIRYSEALEFNKFRTMGNISIKPGFSFGAGYIWQSNFFAPVKSSTKPFFLTIGLQGNYTNFITKLEQYELKDSIGFSIDNNGIKYGIYRIVESCNITEKMEILKFRFPIGIAYQVLNIKQWALGVELSYIPEISLNNISYKGSGLFDEVYDLNNNGGSYSVIDDLNRLKLQLSQQDLENNSVYRFAKSRYLGERKIENSLSVKTKVSHNIRFSILLYKDLLKGTDGIGVRLGLDAILGLQPIIYDNKLEQAKFEYIDDEGRDRYLTTVGLLGSYVQDVRINNLGFRVLIYRKISKKP